MKYRYSPKPDITAFELAQLVGWIDFAAFKKAIREVVVTIPDATMAQLDPSVRRHFEPVGPAGIVPA